MQVKKHQNTEFTVAICDDDQMIRKQLREIVEDKMLLQEASRNLLEFESAEDVLAYTSCQENRQIDLLYLDIEMQGMNGIQLMQQLVSSDRVWRIVFVTNHPENILSSFSIKTVGFLIKPLAEEEVSKKLQNVLQEWQQKRSLLCKGIDGRYLIFRHEDILYFEADRNYCKIYYIDNTKKITSQFLDERIGELEHHLAQMHFLRIHKSFLVNLMYVDSVHDRAEMYHGKVTLPIGRSYKETARHALLGYVAGKVRERI